jgi:hypothetical protein
VWVHGRPAHYTDGPHALVAQRIEHLTTDQKVGGSIPSECTTKFLFRASWAAGASHP